MQCKSLENGFTGLVRRAWDSYTTRVLSYWGNNNDFSLTHFWRNGWKRREKIIVVTLMSSFERCHDWDIRNWRRVRYPRPCWHWHCLTKVMHQFLKVIWKETCAQLLGAIAITFIKRNSFSLTHFWTNGWTRWDKLLLQLYIVSSANRFLSLSNPSGTNLSFGFSLTVFLRP